MSPKDLAPAAIDFLHVLAWDHLPEPVRHQARRCLLDTLGVAAGGHGMRLSGIIRDHAALDMPGPAPMLFDRTSSLAGAAIAAGMMIDSLDGQDGFNPAKGHIGAPLLPGLLGLGHQAGISVRAFLAALVAGYELGGRVAVSQHASCPYCHTSGSWGSVAVAGAGARFLGLDPEATRRALGIAEYHGPRSQMMRCIDFPTMLKDGAGWGALCGVSAVQLSQRGFSGAPALTVEQSGEPFADLGRHWVILDQYFEPYPVCRWAQGAVEDVLHLRKTYCLTSDRVDFIRVETLHESCRLATARPRSTEEAQYSMTFPSAVAMVRGALRPADIADDTLEDPEVLRLFTGLRMEEHAFANRTFPAQCHARVALHLKSGEVLQGDWLNPLWTAEVAPIDSDLTAKFHDLADPVLGEARANAIEAVVWSLHDLDLTALTQHLFTNP